MNITKTLVSKVISMQNKKLHPQEWLDFMNLPEVDAVRYALTVEGRPGIHGPSIDVIVYIAKQYLAIQAEA